MLIQLNIQSDQQTDVDPEDCQVTVQVNEQDVDIAVEGDTGAVVVAQQNVQASSQLAIVRGTEATSTEVCQELIQINEQSANVDAEGEDLILVVTQESDQIADQQTVST